MQVKKRAKSVKFGKKTEKVEKPDLKAELKQDEKVENVENVESVTPEVETQAQTQTVTEEKPAREELDRAQEIKQEIAAKISSKAQSEETEEAQTPEEVDLTTEPEQQEKVEQAPAAFGSFTKDFEEPKKKNNFMFFVVILLITFIVGLLIIGGFYYVSNKHVSSSTPTPAPTLALSPTQEPSPTETSIDLSKFTIKILNGSEISGLAAKVKTQLTDANFKVDSVGNADKSDFTKTVISAKKTVSDSFISQLKKELGKSYLVESNVESLSDSSETDVVVTIGSSTAK